jgi:hypothetical protein
MVIAVLGVSVIWLVMERVMLSVILEIATAMEETVSNALKIAILMN